MILALLMALASCAGAVSSPDAPFFVRELKDQQDVGAINQNFRALSDYVRNIDTSSGSGGDVTKAGNNAFTGNNTHAGTEVFNSTVTVGNAAALNSSQVLDYSRAVIGGVYSAGISSFTAATAITLTNLQLSRGEHVFTLPILQNTSNAYLYARFDGDTGSNYIYQVNAGYGTSWSATGPAAQTLIALCYTTSGYCLGASTAGTFSIRVSYIPGLGATIISLGSSNNGSNYNLTNTGSGQWLSATAPTSITIGVNTGSMTGSINAVVFGTGVEP